MKITFLGTCAGTEPMPTRKHTSFTIESEGRVYWFDAGEGCSYTAHLLGIDLLSVKRIVISHTHMDHVGGLGNLLWNIRKLNVMQQRLPEYGDIELHIPNLETWDGLLKVLVNTEGAFQTDYSINAHQLEDGVVFDDGILKVTAFHNSHLEHAQGEPWRSFSFLIEGEGKKLVYSGDIGGYSDLDPVIAEGCDGLIIETGHIKIAGVREYMSEKNIGKVFFNHSGREILNAPKESEEKVRDLFGEGALICEDGMSIYF